MRKIIILTLGLGLFASAAVRAEEYYFIERITADSTFREVRADDSGSIVFEETLPGHPDFGREVTTLHYTHSIERLDPPVFPDGVIHKLRLKLFLTGDDRNITLTVDSLELGNVHRRWFLIEPPDDDEDDEEEHCDGNKDHDGDRENDDDREHDDAALFEGRFLADGTFDITLTSEDEHFTVRQSVLDMWYAPATPTDVDTDPSALPAAFALRPNYPNPFNPATTIEYALPRSVPVRLEVFDLLGRPVATLVNGMQTAGTHQVVWDGTNDRGEPAASGLYFYRLTAGEHRETRKMLFLK